ncbi:MAG: hypothetical protein Q7S37_05165 [bacterium]|nr:hypothetical protein [bacterium]
MDKIKYLLENKIIYYLILACFLVGLLFLVYQYALLTNFPIGDDPAIHIIYAKTLSYSQIWQQIIYPLPLIIFKYLHNLTSIEYPKLFTLLIPTFLLFSVIAISIYTYGIKKNILIPITAAILFSTARWTIDGLRMGLLAETFGWVILLITLIGLSRQNIIITLIGSILLPFSHPFSTVVYTLIFLLYFIISIKNPLERKFLFTIAGAYLALFLLFHFLKPELIDRFVNFSNPEVRGWGERSFINVITGEAPYRFLIPLVSLIGIIVSFKDWKKPVIKISYLLLLVGMFFSFNHLFGMQFIVFRFYPYLEMGMIIFAAIGLNYLITNLKYKSTPALLLTIIFSLILAAPNFHINRSGIKIQAHDVSAKAIMLPADQAAIEWIDKNTLPTDTIATDIRHSIWITALANRAAFDYQNIYFDSVLLTKEPDPNLLTAKYIYYPIGHTIPEEITQFYKPIFSQDGVTIEVKK